MLYLFIFFSIMCKLTLKCSLGLLAKSCTYLLTILNKCFLLLIFTPELFTSLFTFFLVWINLDHKSGSIQLHLWFNQTLFLIVI